MPALASLSITLAVLTRFLTCADYRCKNYRDSWWDLALHRWRSEKGASKEDTLATVFGFKNMTWK